MRVRSAVGLLVALVLAGCGEDEPRDRAAARTTATPTASPTPTPTPASGRLTDAQVKTLERADRRARSAKRAYERAAIECGRTATDIPACFADAYRPYGRALKAMNAKVASARDTAGRQCRALLKDLEPATRKVGREYEAVQRAVAEQRYDDVADAGEDIAEAQLAYAQALKNALDSCEDI
jgi:hypothetical protein